MSIESILAFIGGTPGWATALIATVGFFMIMTLVVVASAATNEVLIMVSFVAMWVFAVPLVLFLIIATWGTSWMVFTVIYGLIILGACGATTSPH